MTQALFRGTSQQWHAENLRQGSVKLISTQTFQEGSMLPQLLMSLI